MLRVHISVRFTLYLLTLSSHVLSRSKLPAHLLCFLPPLPVSLQDESFEHIDSSARCLLWQ